MRGEPNEADTVYSSPTEFCALDGKFSLNFTRETTFVTSCLLFQYPSENVYSKWKIWLLWHVMSFFLQQIKNKNVGKNNFLCIYPIKVFDSNRHS